ncbi:uncharacterized protein OCT59_010122 [Rhizophagus irregularis]|uniref:F-box domain-containing protein n=1 Tax=Rhizophagus irregularis (strain DAOM 197198w) TaxID=1432141 RepID=A0A015L943_RHIIW|nr:hypothetical protein RirG_035500 [Rhizophagus irregularis DAOM 197198w]UZO18813.1 hypothetical protein OCT59_010122 [Rhizophagus irregularis]
MSKLNKDILYLLFEELQDNSNFLFSCLMVNKLWCEIVIPLLWKDPWRYIDYRTNKNPLYSIITSYFSDDIKEFLKKEGIQILGQSLAFDYLTFCRSINVDIIDDIISVGSSLEYERFLLQEEIYNLLMRKCPEIKYLDIRGTYQIFYLPEAKTRLESLCELTCNTSIDPDYFYRLARVCQNIQRIIIINKKPEFNHGSAKLIEVQKNLKYFKLEDEANEDSYAANYPYAEIFDVLKEHANTLDHVNISLWYEYDYNDSDYIFLPYTLLELYKLKTLDISFLIFPYSKDFEKKIEMVAYRDLEIFEINVIDIHYVTCIIRNSKYLRKLIIHDYYEDFDDEFNVKTLHLIRTICENCNLVEYLSIPVFPFLENHFIEFEKLLKKCQKLRSLVFKDTETYETKVEIKDCEKLLDMLIKTASINLREIVFNYEIKFSLKILETFFEKWRGRPAISISIYSDGNIYRSNDYMNLINKYKAEGVIKDFRN